MCAGLTDIQRRSDETPHLTGRRWELFFGAHLPNLDQGVTIDGTVVRQASLARCKLTEASKKQDSKRLRGSDDELPSVKRLGRPQRYRLRISYEGKHFHGWQKQHPPGREPLRTIQEVLEAVVRRILQQKVRCHCAGRTDAGVSALGQVVQFDAVTSLSTYELVERFNAALPGDINVTEATIAAPKFSAMNSLWKRYVYTISDDDCLKVLSHEIPKEQGRAGASVSEKHAGRLDTEAMQQAGKMLVGTHDFAAFRNKGSRSSTVRTLFRCEVTAEGSSTRILMEGDGFLYNMCRIIAGTLLQVGCGLRSSGSLLEVIECRDRQKAGPTMPAEGLCLAHIEYDAPFDRTASISSPKSR